MSSIEGVAASPSYAPFANPTEADMLPVGPFREFTVSEYHRLTELGIFDSDERLELLEGIVSMMSPIGLSHGQSVFRTTKALEKILPPGRQAISQQSISFPSSEPVPDVIVIRGDFATFTELPKPSDIPLIVEVADSTLQRDRTVKYRIYAKADVPEYWVVNLIERKLEVYRKPVAAVGDQPARFESAEVFGPEQSVEVVLDGAKLGAIAVRDILP